MNKTKIILSVLSILLFSCNQDDNIEMAPYKPKVVVEGAIEENEYATVLLSISASMTGPKDTLSLLNNVIRSAKVTVSDGVSSEILILQTNKNKVPPYEYKGEVLKGEVGKNYSLKIEYDGKIITGTTYIPQSVPLDKISFKKENVTDIVGYVHIGFKNISEDYYQIATCVVPDEKIFTPCLYGNIDSRVYSKGADVSMQINKGPIIFPETSYKTYFNELSTIDLKFSTMPKDGYKFWTSYQNEVLNTQNPIFPANTSLVSNINGGIGIWCGYGTRIYHIKLKDIKE